MRSIKENSRPGIQIIAQEWLLRKKAESTPLTEFMINVSELTVHGGYDSGFRVGTCVNELKNRHGMPGYAGFSAMQLHVMWVVEGPGPVLETQKLFAELDPERASSAATNHWEWALCRGSSRAVVLRLKFVSQ